MELLVRGLSCQVKIFFFISICFVKMLAMVATKNIAKNVMMSRSFNVLPVMGESPKRSREP